jgi:hypothetical protein
MRCPYPGCTREPKPGGKWCSDDHKVRGFKLKKATGGMLPRERKRVTDAAAKRAAREQGVIASDVRISWNRAVDVLADELGDFATCWTERRRRAEEILREALPPRLREHV